jgi:hypothetical protein
MGPHLAIAFFFAATDALYWLKELIFHLKVVDPDGPPIERLGGFEVWTRAAISGVGGVGGAYALVQLTNATDLLTVIVGAFIGGRIVGGAVASYRGQ